MPRFEAVGAIGAAALAMLVMLPAPAARADVVVVESRLAGLAPGTRLGDGARLKVPAGSTVKVLRADGQMQDIQGPYDRQVGDISRGEPVNEQVRRAFQEAIDRERGKNAGGTRGGTR